MQSALNCAPMLQLDDEPRLANHRCRSEAHRPARRQHQHHAHLHSVSGGGARVGHGSHLRRRRLPSKVNQTFCVMGVLVTSCCDHLLQVCNVVESLRRGHHGRREARPDVHELVLAARDAHQQLWSRHALRLLARVRAKTHEIQLQISFCSRFKETCVNSTGFTTK